jgi:hypothetical protein
MDDCDGGEMTADGRGVRAAEVLALVGAAAAAALLAVRVACSVDGPADGVLVTAALLAGWVAADLVSGVVHWWADRIAAEDFPVLGPLFVRPFREHHEDPTSICRHDFVATNGNTGMVVLAFLVAACAWTPRGELSAGALFSSAGCLGLAVWSGLTNQIHQWAHEPSPPRVVRRLQGAGLLLKPAHHARHHRAPFARCYCITAGWLDPLLDGLGLFPALERALGRLQRGSAAS